MATSSGGGPPKLEHSASFNMQQQARKLQAMKQELARRADAPGRHSAPAVAALLNDRASGASWIPDEEQAAAIEASWHAVADDMAPVRRSSVVRWAMADRRRRTSSASRAGCCCRSTSGTPSRSASCCCPRTRTTASSSTLPSAPSRATRGVRWPTCSWCALWAVRGVVLVLTLSSVRRPVERTPKHP